MRLLPIELSRTRRAGNQTTHDQFRVQLALPRGYSRRFSAILSLVKKLGVFQPDPRAAGYAFRSAHKLLDSSQQISGVIRDYRPSRMLGGLLIGAQQSKDWAGIGSEKFDNLSFVIKRDGVP